MNDLTPWIEHLKAEVETMKKHIEDFRTGKADIGNVESNGHITSLKEEMIAHYERTIEGHEGIIRRAEAKAS